MKSYWDGTSKVIAEQNSQNCACQGVTQKCWYHNKGISDDMCNGYSKFFGPKSLGTIHAVYKRSRQTILNVILGLLRIHYACINYL